MGRDYHEPTALTRRPVLAIEAMRLDAAEMLAGLRPMNDEKTLRAKQAIARNLLEDPESLALLSRLLLRLLRARGGG